MAAFDRFTKFGSTTPTLWLDDGDYTAWVVSLGGTWSWVVWHKGAALKGRKGWNMGAHEACEEAVAAIERLKAAERRPYFTDAI